MGYEPTDVPGLVNGGGILWITSQILVYYSMGKTYKASVDWLGMVENGGDLPGQDVNPSVNGGMAQTGIEFEAPKRDGERQNPNGGVSTHIMKTETIDGINWVSFPTLFQNEDGSWDNTYELMIEKDPDNWRPAMLEAKRRGELLYFGPNKEDALKYGEGSWKPKKALGGPAHIPHDDVMTGHMATDYQEDYQTGYQDHYTAEYGPQSHSMDKGVSAQNGDEIIQGGMLPEVEVSALTDDSYNKLSSPQQKIYDFYETPYGTRQTIPTGLNTNMHWKDALRMVEEQGLEEISHESGAIFNKLFNRGSVEDAEAGRFTPHANTFQNKITIPDYKSFDYSSGFNSFKWLDVRASIDELEKIDVNKIKNAKTDDDLDAFSDLEWEVFKKYKKSYTYGHEEDVKSGEKDFTYMDWNQRYNDNMLYAYIPDDVDLQEIIDDRIDKHKRYVADIPGNRAIDDVIAEIAHITESNREGSNVELIISLLRDWQRLKRVPFKKMRSHLKAYEGWKDDPFMRGKPLPKSWSQLWNWLDEERYSDPKHYEYITHKIIEPWLRREYDYNPTGVKKNNPMPKSKYDNPILNSLFESKFKEGGELSKAQDGTEINERDRFIKFIKENEGGHDYIRAKNSAIKKLGEDGEWDGESYYKIFDEGTQKYYPYFLDDEGGATIGHGHHNDNVYETYKDGITIEKAEELLNLDVDNKMSDTEIWWTSKYGDEEWDKLDESTQYLLGDMAYNTGHIRNYKIFADAIKRGDFKTAEENYSRGTSVGGPRLGRNETYMAEYLRPWINEQKLNLPAPPLNKMPLPIGVFPTDIEGNAHSMRDGGQLSKAQAGLETYISDIEKDHSIMTDYWNDDDPNSLLNKKLRGDFLKTEKRLDPWVSYYGGSSEENPRGIPKLADYQDDIYMKMGESYLNRNGYDVDFIREKVQGNLKNLGINNIKDLDPETEEAYEWLNNLPPKEEWTMGTVIQVMRYLKDFPRGSHMLMNRDGTVGEDGIYLSPAQERYFNYVDGFGGVFTEDQLIDIYGHEMGHGTLGNPYNMSDRDKRILSMLRQDTTDKDIEWTDHHEDPSEIYSDLQGVRLDMLDRGIFDWRKEQMTDKHWNDYLKTYENEGMPITLQRLIDSYRLGPDATKLLKEKGEDFNPDDSIKYINNVIAMEDQDLDISKYGGQHNWALDLRSSKTPRAQAGKEVKSDDIYSNDRYSQSASKYKKMLPKYQSRGESVLRADNTYVQQPQVNIPITEEEQYVDDFGSISGSHYPSGPKPTLWKKIRNAGANPFATFGYSVRNEEIPWGNVPRHSNAFDTFISGMVNPFSWLESGEASYDAYKEGDILGGTLELAGAAPVIPASISTAKKLLPRFGGPGLKTSTTHTYNPRNKTWIKNNAPKVKQKLLANDTEYLIHQDYLTNKIVGLKQGKIKITEEIKQFKINNPGKPVPNDLTKVDNIINNQLKHYGEQLDNIPPTYTEPGPGSIFGEQKDHFLNMDEAGNFRNQEYEDFISGNTPRKTWTGPTLKSGNEDIIKRLNAELKHAEKLDLERLVGDYKWDNRNIFQKYFNTPEPPINLNNPFEKPYWFQFSDSPWYDLRFQDSFLK